MKIAFICVHNSCRSQMAEALARYKIEKLGLDIEVFSAGSDTSRGVNPQAIRFIQELYKIDMKDHYAKLIETLPKDIDIAISMGCDIACPSLKAKYYFDFNLIDPSGSDDKAFKEVIKTLDSKITNLLNAIKTHSLQGFIC